MNYTYYDSQLEAERNRMEEELAKIAEKYDLIPSLLKDIIRLRNRNLNQSEIAARLRVSRNTVAKYLATLEHMPQPDFLKILVWVLLVVGGVYILNEILGDGESDKKPDRSPPRS